MKKISWQAKNFILLKKTLDGLVLENGDEALTIFIKSQRNGDQAYDMSMLQNWLIERIAQHVKPYS